MSVFEAMDASPPLFAEVAVNSAFPHRQTFSYAVPAGIDVRPGHAVYVPFGKLTLQGIVIEVHDTPVFSEPEKIRPVRSLIGDTPLLDADRVALARWIAAYYLAPVFDSVALFLPPGFERKPLTIVRPARDAGAAAPGDLPPRQRDLLDALLARGPAPLDDLRAGRPAAGVDSAVVNLERRGLVEREYRLARPRIGPKTVPVAALRLSADDARRTVDAVEPPKPSRRAALLERLVERPSAPQAEALRLAGGRANFDRLLRAGAVRYGRDGHDVCLAIPASQAADEARAMRRTRRATEALLAIDALARDGDLPLSTLRAAGVATATAHWLAEAGVVALGEEAVERDPLAHMHVPPRPPAALLPAQAAAAAAICAAMDVARLETFLLHGVTGSGKTEVYLHALARCVALGRRAIVLVPEIALTPQTVRRFRERFERVAVLHSALSDGEMFDQWHGIAAGRYDVVIGPRSAIFAPLAGLGLVVIDEEHEWTYKQHDPPPRYHARDVALELCRAKRAVLVLGSATPDVASFRRAEREWRLLTLPERVRPLPAGDGTVRPQTTTAMPQVIVADMREELHAGNRGMFSVPLRRAVEQSLAAGEQVILFLNRRGLAGHVQCRDCGFVPQCSACFVALTFHRQYERLVCHQCNRQIRLPATCRQCGSPRVRLVGAGVEKVEAEAARMFPHARLLRWDRDVTRGKHAHERILASFLAHEADILIGTQMLAKGLDLPSVTVVGVVNADIGLHLPDFRAGERTFQLLTQVAGRAGRGERAGRVFIQTYNPGHYAIDAAARYDYEGFAAAEIERRRDTGYPPFARLVRLQFAHTNARYAREEALRMQRALALRRAEFGSDCDVLGPTPAYVPRVRGRWRWQIVLRGRDPAEIVRGFLLPQGWIVDVDPVMLV